MITEKIKPAPDSQFRLVPCECGGEPIYRHMIGEAIKFDVWDVYCPTCGEETGSFGLIRHDAQLLWNTGMVKSRRCYDGCRD